jgi:hypothetical protein
VETFLEAGDLLGDRPLLDGLDFSMISAEDALWLERPFDEEEVAGVVAGFNGDKAPGPDGFSMGFVFVNTQVYKGICSLGSFQELPFNFNIQSRESLPLTILIFSTFLIFLFLSPYLTVPSLLS